MGVVYKARDPYIGRLVALKTITTGLTESPDLLGRFYREAQSAGGLQHPNIVTIFELGIEGDTPFIAMQFLDGGSLDKLIESRASIPLSQKIGYIVYVCRALDYAHRHDPAVIHRDIKPGNVMVTKEGVIKVVDFGIARVANTDKTHTGSLIGTFGYMSPQLFQEMPADVQSDIWSVGIMFYELLAGRRPFEGDTAALVNKILKQETPDLNKTAPGTPGDVIAVVERMLKKEVGERFHSMDEVLIELEPIWERLQQVEVSSLLSQSQELMQAHELGKAQNLLRRALQIDTSNVPARALLEKVNAEIRRDQILPQVRGRVEKGRNLLQAGRFDEAKAEAEAALQLDSVFQPARELLAEIQAAAEKSRVLVQAVRIAQQRLAEGDLTEAERQLTRALEIDSADASALGLLKQIREEQTRRERQKRAIKLLHQCRSLWSELQYDECIRLLLEGQKEFPGDVEIAKLLETARHDQAEQQRQALLTECRNLLQGQKFEEAVEAAERVLRQFPSNSTAKNLRTLAQQGREQQRRKQQLQRDLSILRALAKEGKYAEVIARGERLLQELPKEFELGELLTYARNEQAQEEQKARRERWLAKIRQEMAKGQFSEAAQDAQTALGEFAQDGDLKILLEKAKKEKGEKEKREILEQRVREIKARIVRGELTDAMDLAHQTMATVGHDTDVTLLLQQAQMEHQQREEKRHEQHTFLATLRTLIGSGKFADATNVLEQADQTRLFPPNDPQLADLRGQLEEGEAKTRLGSLPPSATSPTPSRVPASESRERYIYQQGTASGAAFDQDNAETQGFSATRLEGPTVRAPQHNMRQRGGSSANAGYAVPQPAGAGARQSSMIESKNAAQDPAAALPLWKRPLVIGGIAAVLALTVGLTVFRKRTPGQPQPQLTDSGASTTPQQSPQQGSSSGLYTQVVSDTEQFIRQRRWDDAEARLRDLPASRPEYNVLKNQITAGRRNSSKLNSRSTEAAATKNGSETQAHRGPAPFPGDGGSRTPPPSPSDAPLRLGGNVMDAKKIRNVLPVYPPIAKTAHIQGTVLLNAIIGKDGSVEELQYISGPALLMRAAMDAVRQWQYQPMLVQGAPVRVETQVQVIFSLSLGG
jgi:TonB family protein